MTKITFQTRAETLFGQTKAGDFFEFDNKIYMSLDDDDTAVYNFTDGIKEHLDARDKVHLLDVEIICSYAKEEGANQRPL